MGKRLNYNFHQMIVYIQIFKNNIVKTFSNFNFFEKKFQFTHNVSTKINNKHKKV